MEVNRLMVIPSQKTVSHVQHLQSESSRLARVMAPDPHVSISKNINHLETREGYHARLRRADDEIIEVWKRYYRHLSDPKVSLCWGMVTIKEIMRSVRQKYFYTDYAPRYLRYDLEFPGDAWECFLNETKTVFERHDLTTEITDRIVQNPHVTIVYAHSPFPTFELEDLFDFLRRQTVSTIQLSRVAITKQTKFCGKNSPITSSKQHQEREERIELREAS